MTLLSRRTMVASAAATLAVSWKAQAGTPPNLRFVSSSHKAAWQDLSHTARLSDTGTPDVRVATDQPAQIIEGFGACFNELGFDALGLLPRSAREAVIKDFFSPDDDRGLGFTRCRMPVGANDFSRDWYSCAETPNDFRMERFSLARDSATLIPFITSAQRYQKDLTLWASPWSPPTWMKTNGHYAQRPAPLNGMTPEQAVPEGSDGFIQDERYFKAYALYFRRFIEGYRAHGIPIDMVMPQNEFNSDQTFPSCVWSPAGLARFIPHLDKEMGPLGVALFFGTMERPDTRLFESVYEVPAARAAIKGIGLQWAGRSAAPFLSRAHPDLRLYQTEQECGDGRNDWRYARYTWDLMRDYMRAGVSAYHYWNMALVKDQASTWGWKQNSLVVVDKASRTFTYTPDYYVLKHVAHFVRPGARRVTAQSWTGYDNTLAFENPDGRQILVMENEEPVPMPVQIGLSGRVVAADLPPNSLNTFCL